MPASEIPDLVGKIIGVKYGSGNPIHAYLDVAGFELKVGRQFLVGKTIDIPQFKSVSDIRVCIAWDAVVGYYEFDSVEHCRATIAYWYPPEEKKTKKRYFWFSWKNALVSHQADSA
jgi:hypothetical protein